MDTRDLAVFAKVYELRAIGQAARELYLSPQGTSKIIQRLEAELSVQLFGRYHFGLKPTPQADALYHRARTLIDILDGIKGEIDQVKAEKYALSVASTQGILEYLTLLFTRDVAVEFPHVSLRFVESSDSVARARLLGHEAELGILGGPIDLAAFRAAPFTRHRPCLVVHRDNPLAARRAVSYEDLDHQPLAMMSREFASSNLVVNRLLNAGVRPDIVVESNELSLCHLLAQKGEAIAVSFDFAAWGNRRDETVVVPFQDEGFVWETFLVWPAASRLGREAQEFKDFSLAWVARHAGELFHWPAAPGGDAAR